ncbi:MAG TPA: GtrA family protein, partial [Chitinophagaceae bacterium]|nr:GtrA family protein [Chitinophagaceae bacterium]
VSVIDFFYPPFRKLMPLQTFRYAACGGGNTLFDIFLYFIVYNFILRKQYIHTPTFTVSPHIGALIIASTISFFTGFFLMRTVVFNNSTLRGRVQLFRYLLLVLVCFVFNYLFMKLFVEKMHIFPTIAKVITTVLVVSFSYLTQKKFTFKE